MPSGGNTYTNCAGVGQRVREVTPPVGVDRGRVGSNGTGVCFVCGRIISQRGGIASRHADKRDSRSNPSESGEGQA
jgi:hypothetical protein